MIFAHLWSKELPNNLGNIHERPPYTNKADPKKGEDMFCVIQEVIIKRIPKGEPKGIEVCESTWGFNGETYTHYNYRYSEERFKRTVNKAYRISIHESYREKGKVKKKQTVICTIGYYHIVSWGDWIGDYVRGGLKAKADILGLTEEELSDLVYAKWQPIVDRVWDEFKQTEEYRVKKENERIIKEHNQRMKNFKEKYDVGKEEYQRCYDVFGKLRNPECLKKIKADYEARKEYERKSREQSRSYYENYHGNYGSNGSSSYFGNIRSNYNEGDRAMLKNFYRMLSKAYHPDSNPDKDTSEEMKMLNRLKDEWGI